jgi:hypothetical protein
MTVMVWLGVVAVSALVVGQVLMVVGQGVRRRGLGLGQGETIALDDVTLRSRCYGLVGRPDRMIRECTTRLWQGPRKGAAGSRGTWNVAKLKETGAACRPSVVPGGVQDH